MSDIRNHQKNCKTEVPLCTKNTPIRNDKIRNIPSVPLSQDEYIDYSGAGNKCHKTLTIFRGSPLSHPESQM